MESSEWPRTGLFSGVTMHLGHYAECLRSEGSGIHGKYCLAQATYDFDGGEVTQIAPGWAKWAEEDASAWKVIKMVIQRSPKPANEVRVLPEGNTEHHFS